MDDFPVVQVVQVSQVRVVEVPQLQLVEKSLFPEVLTVQFTQTFGSLGTAREVQFWTRPSTCPLVFNFVVHRQKTAESPQLQFIVVVMS